MNQYANDKLLDAPGMNPVFARKCKAVLADIRAKGGQWYVFEALRTNKRQRYLFAIGRSNAVLLARGYTSEEIAAYRKQGAKVSLPWVTQLLSSPHIKGIAADIVPIINGELTWDVPASMWALIGSSAKAHELTWGGNWKSVDQPHIQLGS